MKTLLAAATLAASLAAFAAPAFADGSYTGPNGGSAQWQGGCGGGPYRAACHRSWTATGPEGQTWSGGATAYGGPWRAGVSRHVTGPDGNTVYGRRAWRRW